MIITSLADWNVMDEATAYLSLVMSVEGTMSFFGGNGEEK
jgi:hypothetical protein